MKHPERGVDRRTFLRRLGLAGTALVGLPAWAGAGARPAAAAPGESAPAATKKRHWVMVVDLKKCDGCESIGGVIKCTEACIIGHHIPTKDGRWIQQWIEVFKLKYPGGGTYYFPLPCQQCENAPCVNVCPVGASYHNHEGAVLVDHRRCIGCRLCMAACPYGRRFFHWDEPPNPPGAVFSRYTPEFPLPHIKGTVVKCIFCVHNLHQGKLPICVVGCPMGALYTGDLVEDIATNGRELMSLRRWLARNNAYRYKEKLGTEPRVYYLPGHGEEFGRRPL